MTIPPLSSSEDESARSQPVTAQTSLATPGAEPSAGVSEIHSEDDLIDLISDALDNAADYDMGWRDYAKRVASALLDANAVRIT